MSQGIEIGYVAFIDGRVSAIGAIRDVMNDSVLIYVENSGDFSVPITAVIAVHDGKVVLDKSKLQKPLLAAVDHSHDQEDSVAAG